MRQGTINNKRLDKNELIENIYEAIGDTDFDDAQTWYDYMIAQDKKYKKGRAPDKVKQYRKILNGIKVFDNFKITEGSRELYNGIFHDIRKNKPWSRSLETLKKFAPIIQIKYGGRLIDSISDYNDTVGARHELKQQVKTERLKGEANVKKAKEEGEEKLRELKSEDNVILNNRVAEQKHKYKDELEALREENEKLKQNQFQPSIKEYIKNKVRDGSFKLDSEDLHKMLAKDKGKGLITDENIDNVVKAIYLEGNRYVVKNKKRIAQLARLQGYNPNEYAKLPEETQKEVNDYIVEKFNDDLRRKNLKYILPKDKPRWQKAQVLFKLNPNLGRGAWSH